MLKIKPVLPSREVCKQHMIEALHEYFNGKEKLVSELQMGEKRDIEIQGPLKLIEVQLPDWGACCGINDQILVPVETITKNSHSDWESVDWWMAAFILLEAWHERVFEYENGSIQSYSFRLKGWDSRAWDHAWVNRIGLFLNLWACRKGNINEESMGSINKGPSFLMTHDVDAIYKTFPIRIKQFVFNIFNVFVALKKRNFKLAFSKLSKAFRFLFSNEDWGKLDKVLQYEENAGLKSMMNFFSDQQKKNLKRWLFDPSYDLKNKNLQAFIKKLIEKDFIVGIHPGFDTWNNQSLMISQIEFLSKVIDHTVVSCRQHWLRFSWDITWNVQYTAGIRFDTTMMFNDRPGFRVSAALKYNPWDHVSNESHMILSLPSVMMDSHFYDYSFMTDLEREANMSEWINEIKFVKGDSAVLWHPHTLANDYGWENGFLQLLKLIK